MRIKHWHKWESYCTYNGGGTNGRIRVCKCGSARRFGVAGNTMVNEYKVRGQKWWRPIGHQRTRHTESQKYDNGLV